VFEDDQYNQAYILMDYVEGPNLDVLRKRQPEKRFSLSQVLKIMAPIVDAVAYLHGQVSPVIHRDVKPANIIVPKTGKRTVLVDFGIAKEYHPDSTTTAIRHCSPGYGAPEQYGGLGTDMRTDIYGLGATCYTLLTGTVPVDALHRATRLASREKDPLIPVNELVPAIPSYVADALHRAMSIGIDKRFSTVEEFWQALNVHPTQQLSPETDILPSVQSNLSGVSHQAVENAPPISLQKQEDVPRSKKFGVLAIVFALLIIISSGFSLGTSPACWLPGAPRPTSCSGASASPSRSTATRTAPSG
jgi:serine/threonine protein kinase